MRFIDEPLVTRGVSAGPCRVDEQRVLEHTMPPPRTCVDENFTLNAGALAMTTS